MRIRLAMVLLLLCGLLPGAWAQNASAPSAEKPREYYRLDISLSEFDGAKKVNTRNYSMMLRSGGSSSLKIGNRMPISVNGAGKDMPVSVQYMDVGLNISCRYEGQQEGNPELACDFEMSSLVPQQENPDSRPGAPILRQMHGSGSAIAPLGKPTLFASLENPTAGPRFQFEVTATRAK